MADRRLKTVVLVALLIAGVGVAVVLRDHLPTVEQVRAHRQQLLALIRMHYLASVLAFIGLYCTTALVVPGALVLSVAGGLMFGTVPAAIYLNIGATVGAVLAFLAARFTLKEKIQRRFKEQLVRFNHEMERHGPNYLLVLRLIPVLPFFVVNYGAGISKVRLRTFVWTTSLGILPGSFIHTYIGHQFRSVNAAHELASWKILAALGALALLALAPVLKHHLQSRKG